MALINTGSIANELRPGLAALTGAYARYPSQWKEVFNVYTSDKYEEIEVEMRFTGLAQIKPEGGPIAVDTMGQRIITTYLHRNVGISFIITQEALQDNLYKTRFPMQSKSLLDSMEQAKETLGMAVLNNGFSASSHLETVNHFSARLIQLMAVLSQICLLLRPILMKLLLKLLVLRLSNSKTKLVLSS